MGEGKEGKKYRAARGKKERGKNFSVQGKGCFLTRNTGGVKDERGGRTLRTTAICKKIRRWRPPVRQRILRALSSSSSAGQLKRGAN